MSEKPDEKLAGIQRRQYTTPQAAARYGRSTRWFEKVRREGGGPLWRRVSSNKVVYDHDDLEAYFMDDERFPKFSSHADEARHRRGHAS